MLRRILWFLLAFPAAVVLVTLAVINRHSVRLVLDPFRPEEPLISLQLPFYFYLFGALLAGIVVGGLVMWMAQARWRHLARRSGAEAVRWHAEADRLARERDKQIVAVRQLAPADR